MIATVQYDHLRGTAAADISDKYKKSLQEYLIKRFSENYNKDRYICVGCSFKSFDQRMNNKFTVSFICWDKHEEKHVKFICNDSISYNDFSDLFETIEVVVGIDINEIEVNEDKPLIL